MTTCHFTLNHSTSTRMIMALHNTNFSRPGAALVRKTMCEAMKSLPMHIRRRSYCASSSFVGPVFEDICNETTTVACALPHNNSLHYCDNRRQEYVFSVLGIV